MNRKKLLSFLLAAAMAVCTILPAYGATTQDKLNNAKARKQQTESRLGATQSKIDDLESKKGESEVYLAELNAQLKELKESLEELQKQSEDKQAQLEQVQQDLEEAKEQETQQYEDMKLRIQYMYEQTSSGYMEMLFGAESFSEFLNRAENISQISQYDRDMLVRYQKTKQTIADHETTIKEEKAAIEQLRRESAEKQSQVEELVQATYNQIHTYAAELEDAESREAQLLDQISQQENAINVLLKQAKDEEAAARKAAEAAAAKQAAEEEARRQAAAAAEAESRQQEEIESDDDYREEEVSEAESGAAQSSEDSDEPADSEEEASPEREESVESSASSKGRYLGNFRLTAYCACSRCCGQWAGGSTASGTRPTAGRTVAMGGIAFGTRLLINGQVYTVEDRGTAYGHVDIFMGSHSQALQFGMRYADVYVLE